MLARAGGVAIPAEIAVVKIIRGGKTGQVWYQDLFEYPELDIALRNGDRILVEEDTRAFTALGATGAQTRVKFETQTLIGDRGHRPGRRSEPDPGRSHRRLRVPQRARRDRQRGARPLRSRSAPSG